jgi:hypothetical protein
MQSDRPNNCEGGCECGDIRYAITGEPLALAVCHCTQCQRQSGSAFGMTLVVPRAIFRIASGEPHCYTTVADSGTPKDCFFCGRCGVRIYNAPESMPETVNVKPGTLDDTRWLAPKMQVWCSSQQPWLELPEIGPTFPENPKRGG